MPKINVLPKSVAELIAAGEVVERPSSAVKEMIENSIDAGATHITVEIRNGGVKYLRVTDNGCGIHREDVRTAFISHATSKISCGEDLDAIFTLGFRGEALPSIAAVSRLSMLTKTSEEEIGTGIEIHGGEEVSFDDAGCPDGTTVIVRDLFYNTPARMKFLKKDMTEGTYVADVVAKTALSHPGIKFTLIRDGKQTLSTTGNGDLKSAIYSIFGKEISESLIEVEYEYESIKVHGFISRPLNNRPNRNLQYFFVNGRYVRLPVASAALDEAYKNSIMVGKFPVCFLFVDIPAGKIDVNVHPAKTEIRFSEDSKIFESVFYSAKSALNKGDNVRPEVTLRDKRDVTAKKELQSVQLRFTEQVNVPDEKKADTQSAEIPVKPASSSAVNPVISHASQPAAKSSSVQSIFSAPVKSAETEKFTYKTEITPVKRVDIDIVADEEPCEEKKQSSLSARKLQEDNPEEIKKTEAKPFAVPDTPVIAMVRDTSSVFSNLISRKEAEEKNKGFITYGGVTEKEPVNEAIVEDTPKKAQYRVVGEVFRTYILVEYGDKMLIIDKHAAHERMIFNKLSETDFTGDSQMLLMPVTVTLSAKEYVAVLENIEVFRKGGFLVEDFGDGSVVVRGFPLVLSKEDIPSLITEMAGELVKGKLKPVPEKLTWLYHSSACRAAIKAGDSLKAEETEAFVKKLLADESIRYCPHGRPVMYELSKHEIEKQFGRV